MKGSRFANQKIILIHVLFWVGYLLLSVFVFAGREELDKAIGISLIQIIPQIIIAYINMEWLIPSFFIKKKYFHYTFLVLLCFIGLYLFYEFILPELIHNLFPPPEEGSRWMRRGNSRGGGRNFFNSIRRMRLIYSFTQTLAIFFLSTAFKTSQLALKREKEAADLKSENLNSELKFLRSQINPHFLFNALNNIYSLSILKSEKTPENILKLSDMLRYIIYDCNADKVPLEKEINYINNYIDLQKLKDDRISNITMNFDDADPNCMIAPMILIPFIENAFKHGKIEDIENGFVSIVIRSDIDRLGFKIENSIPKERFTKDKVGGVGLENVKRRLQLIYPDRYKLNIQEGSTSFRVDLSISI
jgi:hypothetical protein